MGILKKLKEGTQDKIFEFQKKKLQEKIRVAKRNRCNKRKIAQLEAILEQLDPKAERKGKINFGEITDKLINMGATLGEAGEKMNQNLMGDSEDNHFSNMVENAKTNNDL